MNLFLLAAGRGTRLMPLTLDVPKCLVSLGEGDTLLGKVLSEAKQSGVIKQVVVIAGYRADKVEEMLNNLSIELPTSVVYNPFYEISSPLVSLYLAHLSGMGREDFIICNGDTFYGAALFKRMAKLNDGITLAMESNAGRDKDGVKVQVDEGGFIKKVGKKLSVESASGVSAGFASIKGSTHRDFFTQTLRDMMRMPDNLDVKTVWHSIFNVMSETNGTAKVMETTSNEWFEIDHLEDHQKFMTHFTSTEDQPSGNRT